MHKPSTVCFVLAGGSGATDRLVELAREAIDVHLLACGGSDEDATALAAAGIVVHRLDELVERPGDRVQHFGGDDPTVVLGGRAQGALEQLHAQHRFDLIEFIDGAVAMHSVQSKHGGAAFLDVALGVRLHAPAFHLRNLELRTLAAPRDLKLDFCERYAFEHADEQSADSPDLLEEAASRGWEIRAAGERLPLRTAGKTVETLTVVVAHYNHERYLEGTLGSLAEQTRPPDEVIVIDDGSTSVAASEIFAAQEKRYPEWRFVRQENRGPGATRNRGLELATGSCFLPFDSDNLATETMVAEFLAAMELNPDCAAMACHNLGFVEDEDIASGRFISRYAPTGGPLVLAAVENVYGDTCSIFRTEALRSVGGFETNLWSPTEDWETFVKMATRGLEVDVLPRPLFYYRTDAAGRLRRLGTDRATKLRLHQHLLTGFFARMEPSHQDLLELFGSLQAFDDFVRVGLEERLAEQRRWHDAQMAELDAFREQQVDRVQTELGARADAADTQVAIERTRAEAAERELAALREAASRSLLRRAVRWRRG